MGPGGSGSLLVINWRTKTVTELSTRPADLGATVNDFTHEDLVEPIDVAVDTLNDRVLVADNGVGAVLVFDPTGKHLRSFGARGNKPGQFKDISALCVAQDTGEVVVADTRLQVFSAEGKFLREIKPPGLTLANVSSNNNKANSSSAGRGRYGGLALDTKKGFLLATRTEKAKSFIQVFDYATGELYSTIDSHGSRMKRPTGLSVMAGGEERHLVVVDIGSDCVRKYRYY